MKLKLFAIIFFSISWLTLSGQSQDSVKESGMMRMAPAEVLAKPVFEGNSDNFHLKVWVMTIGKDEKEVVTGIGNFDNESDIGTHNIIVELADAEKSSEISGARVKVLSLTPSGKKTTTVLEPMLNKYGGKINLEEKGEYQLSVSVEADGKSTLAPVIFNVKSQ